MATTLSTASTITANDYHRDGFIAPIDIISDAEAKALRADLESAEAQLCDTPEKLGLLRSYPDRVLPAFDQLIRSKNLINCAATILGPDLMVWSSSLFIKAPNSEKIVSWHQDLTYWGLDTCEETTLWVALSPATVASGCMKFIPGSHQTQIEPHNDTFAENNLLSRGQEIAVDVDEDSAVAVALNPGQASMHHGHLFHSSGPNTTNDRRIGVAIRYIKPSMKQQSGDRSLVALVGGVDNHNNFTVAAPPAERLAETDFDLCRKDKAIKDRILY